MWPMQLRRRPCGSMYLSSTACDATPDQLTSVTSFASGRTGGEVDVGAEMAAIFSREYYQLSLSSLP